MSETLGAAIPERETLLPFSTGLSFNRRIPTSALKSIAFPLGSLTRSQVSIHVANICLVIAFSAFALGIAHLWFGDASGIVLILIALLLTVFSTAPTTFGLNVLCLASCLSAFQCITSFLGTFGQKCGCPSMYLFLSGHWKQILPEGQILVIFYAIGFFISALSFIWSFCLLYTFDPCHPLIPVQEARPIRMIGEEEGFVYGTASPSLTSVDVDA